MANPFPDFPGSLAGPEAPLEMLAACHIRIRQQCASLQRLLDHLSTNGNDAQARKAAVAVTRYFDTAALDHHADEEDDLFPALIESMAGSDAVCIHQIIEGLVQDHRKLERNWRKLRLVLEKIAAGADIQLPPETVLAFTSLYDRHIALEEDELLPMAARLLSEDQLHAIGCSMRERRGIA